MVKHSKFIGWFYKLEVKPMKNIGAAERYLWVINFKDSSIAK